LGKFYAQVGGELNRVARQLAWLHAVPVAENATVAEQRQSVSRLEKMHKEDRIAFLPDASADFLIPLFLEVGPTMPSGIGSLPLTYSEIEAWKRSTDRLLEPWEARALVAMSREYVAFTTEASKPGCPSPMAALDEMTDEKRRNVANSLKSAFGALMTNPPKPSKIRKRTKKGAPQDGSPDVRRNA
jgi:hypothetical protein